MKTMTVSLSPQQASRVQQAVATGAYASNSEVMRDALRLWEQREEIRALELTRLKQAYAEGIASGRGRDVTAETLLAEFKAKALNQG
ncbi:MAG: type II toxin-antitoxin system ParD family antitoxin [Rhizobiales bacterium]|nr:type II toxin-antitoxin system ParD family antitoxin [Hyphomicrobiales bacterium]